jgi:C4-dicarboxylate-specific signal transduction histidine kinase
VLKIRCWSEHKKIIVEFEDSGPGVPKAIQEQIFEPNFTTKNQSQKFGLGLGLAISSEIIKKHEGDIAVRNAVDGGAIFSISLPVKTDCK